MKTLNRVIGSVCLFIALCSGVQANLIHNGSFEDIGNSQSLGYGNTSTWQVYTSIPNWDASQNVEIWNNDFIVDAHDGNRVLELNAHPSDLNSAFSIFQDFTTVIGTEYQLTFAGRKRQNNSDEKFSVSIGTDLYEEVANQTYGSWNEYSYNFTATSVLSTLAFTSMDRRGDTTGNLFDSVTITTAVPEPEVIMLMLFGLAGIFVSRKKTNR